MKWDCPECNFHWEGTVNPFDKVRDHEKTHEKVRVHEKTHKKDTR
jgi:hypothetical protein